MHWSSVVLPPGNIEYAVSLVAAADGLAAAVVSVICSLYYRIVHSVAMCV